MLNIEQKPNAPMAIRSAGVNALLFALGVSLLFLATMVKIHLPFTPVPISFQLITALMIGVAMGPKRAFFQVLTYVVLLTFAFPSIGNGTGGVLFASFGFLAAMPFAACVAGVLHKQLKSKTLLLKSVPLFAGTIVVYLVGVPWLSMFVGWANVLELGVYPFIALDLARAALAGAMLLMVQRSK